jgi:plastocyanin
MLTNRPTGRWLLSAAVLTAGCGGGGGGGGTGPNRTLAVSAGNNQIGNAGAALTDPLAVVVLDATTSSPAPGVTITWAVTRGGGSVTAPSITDATGIATATRTLGSDTIAQATTATGAGLSGSPVTFNSTSRIQGATQMQLNAGTAQSDTIGATLGTAYGVLVRNETGTPVVGVTVNWSAAGGGSVSVPTSVTSASGIATVNRILGTTVGAQTAQARVTGLNGNPVSFTATATAGDATLIEKTAEPAAGVINTNVTYIVTARDRANNPKSGVVVDWAVTGGGGAITTPSTTGTNGQASATRTLSGTAGPHTATATASSIAGGPSVSFTTNATTAPLAATVTVGNNIFNPAAVTIAATGEVTWNWNPGGIAHNVTFSTGGSPADIANRTSGSEARTFPTAGTFNYTCTIHAGMAGSVTVQ